MDAAAIRCHVCGTVYRVLADERCDHECPHCGTGPFEEVAPEEPDEAEEE